MHHVGDASGSGTSSALAWMSGNSSPCSRCIRRAVASWASVTSTPVGRAPARASQAETYAVPQPSSTTSIPATPGSAPISLSGTSNIPQLNAGRAQLRSAAAT